MEELSPTPGSQVAQVDGNGEVVFCRCCGCFGLPSEFYEEVYCTRACSNSYDLHMSRGPDGKFKKPVTPFLNKKPKLSFVASELNHINSVDCHEPISTGTTEGENEKIYPVIVKKQATVKKMETKDKLSLDVGPGKIKGNNKTSNGVVNNKKILKRKSDTSSKKEVGIKPSLTVLPGINTASTTSEDVLVKTTAPKSPDITLKGLCSSSARGIQRSKSLELPSGSKAFGGTKSTAFYSKDRKRNFPQVLSRRMPVKVSPERKITENVGKDNPEVTETSGRIPNNGEFDWQQYLLETKAKSAPHRLFRQPAMPPPNPFRVGMMLESIDPQHQSLICVAAVVEIQGYRIRLRFQGFSEAYDYWINADSLDIFPPGWCEENNLDLEPPPGAPSPFNWHTYIVENKVEVAPRHIFAISKEDFSVESGVKVGMKLEAVDIRNQNLVCVATVAKVMGDRILVHFDSWDPLYDYWTDLTSPFIHPVGWCEKNNVKLTPPNYCKPDFSWEKYLRETNTQAMPTRLFRPLPPVGFRKGFKIECVDKRNPFLIRVATIAEIEEHHLHVHFDNWPQVYDYKVYELSPDIHPVGWCAHTGHPLQPPPPEDGSWSGPCTVFGCLGLGHMRGPKFLTHNSDKYCPYALHNCKKDWILADRLILLERSMSHSHGDSSSTLEPSQKSRVDNKDACKVDQETAVQHSSTGNIVIAATATTSTTNLLPFKRKKLASNSAPKKRKGKQANTPKIVTQEDDKKSIELINERVELDQILPLGLVENKTKTESDPSSEITVTKLEGAQQETIETDQGKNVDVETPITTKVKLEPRQLLDSSSSASLSPDIHPVGCCAHTGHPLKPPPPEDGSWSGPCTVFGCSGVGHTRGPKFLTHNSDKYCPYALHNCKKDGILADRLILQERSMSHSHGDSSSTLEPSQKSRVDNKDACKVDQETAVQHSSTESELPHNFAANSISLKTVVGNVDEKTVSQWQVARLAEFIATIPGCQSIAKTFMEQLIDGESFLMLSQSDFIKVMGLKLGPAIKLSNVIRMINFNNSVSPTYKVT